MSNCHKGTMDYRNRKVKRIGWGSDRGNDIKKTRCSVITPRMENQSGVWRLNFENLTLKISRARVSVPSIALLGGAMSSCFVGWVTGTR